MFDPEAVFDILYIGSRLEQKINDFSLSEISFFSYLSCLLSIYDGNSNSNWRINFIISTNGTLYSPNIENAFSGLIEKNLIQESSPSYYEITGKGEFYLEKFSTLSSIAERLKYLDSACTCLSLIPFGSIKNAIDNEPVINSSKNFHSRKILLQEDTPAVRYLYAQFKMLHEALGEQKSLLIPAVTWINSLQYQLQDEQR